MLETLRTYPEADVARLLSAYRHVTKMPALTIDQVAEALEADQARNSATVRITLDRAATFTQGTEKFRELATCEDPLFVD